MQAQSRRRGPWRGIAVFLALVFVGPIVVFFAVASACMVFLTPEPAWTAASGEPVPAKFLYAMFPVNATVAVHDAPDGTPMGVLDRAVVNSQREIDAGGWVRVLSPAGDTWVRLSELTYVQPAGTTVDYFAAFAAVYPAQMADGYGKASMTLEIANTGIETVTLHLSQDQEDDRQTYIYELSQAGVKPVEMYVIDGLSVGFQIAGLAMIAMMLYEATVVVVYFVRMVRRWPRLLS